MSDSSTVNVRITADGSQLTKELDNDIRALQAFANSARETNSTAVSAVRASIQAQKEYQESIRASSAQMEKLAQINTQFESRVNAAQANSAARINTIARGFSILETSASSSVRSIDAVANAVGMLAFGFGPEGFLVGAAAMAGVAIVHVFEGIQKSIDETDKKFQDFIMQTKDLGTAKVGAQLRSGDQTELLKQIEIESKKLNGLDEENYGVQLDIVNALKAQLPLVAQRARDAETHVKSLEATAMMEARDATILAQGAHLRAQILELTKEQFEDEKLGLVFKSTEIARMRELQDAYAQNAANAAIMTAESQKEYSALDGAYHIQLARVVPELTLAELRKGAAAYEKAITAEMAAQLKLLGQQAQQTETAMKQPNFVGGKWQPGAPGAGGSIDPGAALHAQLQTPEVVEHLKQIKVAGDAAAQSMGLLGTMTSIAAATMAGVMGQAVAAIFGGKFDTQKLKKQLLEPMVAQLLGTAITEAALGVAALAGIATAATAPAHFEAAQTAAEGAAVVGAMAGIASAAGGSSHGSSSSGGQGSAAQLGSGSSGVPSNQLTKMDIQITVIQKSPDGKELGRLRQSLQRAVDRQQPIRVVL